MRRAVLVGVVGVLVSGGCGGAGVAVGGDGGAGPVASSGTGGDFTSDADAGSGGAVTEGTGGADERYSGGAAGSVQVPSPSRTTRGLQALYTFEEGGGDTVHDVSGVGNPLDLTIADTSAVSWEAGALVFESNTIAVSGGPATKVISACKESNEFSLEAWLAAESTEPATLPAPVVTVSQDADRRNFMLGQTGVAWDLRVRMADTNEAGSPGTASPTVSTEVTHVVYTLDSAGQVMVYGNNVGRGPVDREGDLSGWDEGYALALGNEMTVDNPWAGVMHLAAIYCVALTADEVDANFRSGF